MANRHTGLPLISAITLSPLSVNSETLSSLILDSPRGRVWDPTELASQRRGEQLAGAQGDGPGEFELSEAPEGEQSASRAYAQRYQKLRSQAEAVLDSEPLPLGHRETVRRLLREHPPQRRRLCRSCERSGAVAGQRQI